MRKFLMVLTLSVVMVMLTSFVQRPVEESTVTVKAGYGDTVWNIAREHYSNDDVRSFDEFVWEIRKENNLLGKNVLQAGQDVVIRIKKRN